jgi:LacI family transcriptional regulator
VIKKSAVSSLKEVARLANVHPTTASSILNAASGNSRFGEDTRLRVEAAARKLGYVRNRAAVGLRERRSNSIGLVAGNLLNPFFALLAQELEKCLQPLGYELVLTSHGADSDADETRLAQILFERAVDALLIWSEVRNGKPTHLTGKPGCPRVYLGYSPPCVPSVTINIEKGIELAVGHLARMGCRRISLYSPSYAKTAGLPKPRPEILSDVCRRHRLPRPSLHYHDGESWDLSAAVEGAMRILSGTKDCGGVIGYNDVCATAWALAASELGRECPVVGFDGTMVFRSLPARLPYVDLRAPVMAEAAVTMLMKIFRGERPRPLAIDPEFLSF